MREREKDRSDQRRETIILNCPRDGENPKEEKEERTEVIAGGKQSAKTIQAKDRIRGKRRRKGQK